MLTDPWQKWLLKFFQTLCVASFLLTVFTVYSYWWEKNQAIEKAKNDAKQQTINTAQALETKFKSIEDIVSTIANDLSLGKIKDEELLNRFKNVMYQNPNFYGIGVAYAPYFYSNKLRLYASYYARKKGQLQQIQIEKFYDYTQPGKGNWYLSILASGSAWAEPQFGYASDTLVELFGTTFQGIDAKTQKKRTAGLVFANYSLDTLKKIMHSLDLGKTGFTLGTVFVEDEILVNTKRLHRQLILINLELIFFFFSLFILCFRAYKGRIKNLWLVSSSTSIVLLLGIGYIWYLELTEHKVEQKNNIVLLGKAGLNKFLGSHQFHNAKEAPLYIPTGVFIQSLEFVDANNVFIKGYIWQKYDNNIPQNVSRGFIMPEAVTPTITEMYRHKTKNYEVIGWYFEAKFRENFDYAKYPFDVKDIWIRLWHQDFYKNTILVPDFDAYKLIIPSSRPGLEEDFVLPSWTIKNSFFQYRISNYNTDFGIDNYIGQENFPELHFTVIAQRDFVSILISNMMIIIVVLLLLFCVQILITKQKGNSDNLNFTALEIVSACGAFLFIIIVDQINLRQKIITAGIIYFDYFYFVLYLSIILVAINAILFASNQKINWLDYKDNLIPKLLYWPTNLALLLLMTLFFFF